MPIIKPKIDKYALAVYYQKLNIKTYKGNIRLEKSFSNSELAYFYLQNEQLDSAKNTLKQAKTLTDNNPRALIYYLSVKGMILFLDKKESEAYQNYIECDSLLRQLRQNSNNLIQQKYTRKKSYEIYKNGYDLFMRVLSYENRSYIRKIRQWYQNRMRYEKELYDNTQVSVALKDSLVIARTAPKTQVVKKVDPWWWMAMIGVIGIFGLLLYYRRERTLRASEDFVKALKASPIKGFDNPKPQEIAMLAEIESRIKRQLKLKEIKILLMIARQSSYNQIHLATGIAIGTIKSDVKRLKDKCKVENIRELM
mgnify:CR=1 FL=1